MTGLMNKFNVTRVDGRDKPGGDREGTRYFVLDPTHDKTALIALKIYAIKTENKGLADDLFDWMDELIDTTNA